MKWLENYMEKEVVLFHAVIGLLMDGDVAPEGEETRYDDLACVPGAYSSAMAAPDLRFGWKMLEPITENPTVNYIKMSPYENVDCSSRMGHGI